VADHHTTPERAVIYGVFNADTLNLIATYSTKAEAEACRDRVIASGRASRVFIRTHG